jgi:hypothetical protein
MRQMAKCGIIFNQNEQTKIIQKISVKCGCACERICRNDIIKKVPTLERIRSFIHVDI